MQAQVIDGTLTLRDTDGRYVTFRKGDWITIPDSPKEWPAGVREAARTGQLAIAAVVDMPPQQIVPEPEISEPETESPKPEPELVISESETESPEPQRKRGKAKKE